MEKLPERQIYFQKLLIRRLLEFAQAISNQSDSETLVSIYKNMLKHELNIKNFVLFLYRNQIWENTAKNELNTDFNTQNIVPFLTNYSRISKLTGEEIEELAYFDYIVPIFYKNNPLAVVLIKDLDQPAAYLYDNLDFIATVTNMLAVAIENKQLFVQKIEQERLQRDLELAIQMQNLLIPTQLPQNKRYEFAGIYQPHSGVGGDYYDFIKLDDDEIAFCIADISGKGVAAALLMSNFQANIHALIHRKNLHFRKFIQLLNSSVMATTKGEKFITFFLARYDMQRKRLRYICAGHNPPYLITNDKIHKLDKGCTILGAFNEIPHIEMGEIYLEQDAFLLLYTDGLTDLQNENEVYFNEHLENFILQNYQNQPQHFNEILLKEINHFRGKIDFSDDVSVLTARIFV